MSDSLSQVLMRFLYICFFLNKNHVFGVLINLALEIMTVERKFVNLKFQSRSPNIIPIKMKCACNASFVSNVCLSSLTFITVIKKLK